VHKIAIFLVVVLQSLLACCQSGDAAVAELRNNIKGHKFVLKNFSAQSITLYHLTGDQLETDPSPSVKTVALFAPTDVSHIGSVLVIRGQRFSILLNRSTNSVASSPLGVEASLKIDLGSSNIAPKIPDLIQQLFFTSVTKALGEVPAYLHPLVPGSFPSKGIPPAPCNPCTHWIRQATWLEIPVNDPGLKQPVLIKSSDVEMRAQRPSDLQYYTPAGEALDAIATFSFVVDESGHPTELWLTHAVGHGLDESAAQALRHQIFRPATYKGAHVAVALREGFYLVRY
jgi:Gram-negative bacterial TonB protein C-terminal